MSNSTPYYDETDSNVAAVQRALAHEGYYHGPIDGALDLITQDAIARYDRDHHLPVSHGVDESLMSALGI
jgi:peptidoglycan hydrolase-like protein with peptidoglycan-binding domain